ncbi:MAG: hypothetical protein K1X72_23265 [Pyrinomonadaceae bacterium]|nr:hypothetical protein [Pyrinomonadaceae bacterium]
MAEEKSKLIPFTKELEAAIEVDAKRCERSFVRQVVAVLKAYYSVENVELNKKALATVGDRSPKGNKQPEIEFLGDVDPKGGTDLPHFEINLTEQKQKKRA